MYEENSNSDIRIPDYDRSLQDITSLFFSKEYIKDVCERYHYSGAIIKEFLIDSNDPDLDNDDMHIINERPIIEEEDEFAFYFKFSYGHAYVNGFLV